MLMDRNYFVLFGLLAGTCPGVHLHNATGLMCHALAMLCSVSLSIYVTYLYSIMPYNFGMVSSAHGMYNSDELTYATRRSSDSVRV